MPTWTLRAFGRSSFKPETYFGYLNSGVAFSASLVVFMLTSHLLLLASQSTLTERSFR